MESEALVLCLVLLILPLPSATEFATFRNGSSDEMNLRLANGRNQCVGRVEIFYNGQWGTVCDDLWDMSEAEVVCRQLGCGKPISFHTNAYFGEGKGQIFLDDMNCRGNETALWNCPHRGMGTHNCGHSEDAGVTCSGLTTSTPGPTTKRLTVTYRTPGSTSITATSPTRTTGSTSITEPSTTVTTGSTSFTEPSTKVTTAPTPVTEGSTTLTTGSTLVREESTTVNTGSTPVADESTSVNTTSTLVTEKSTTVTTASTPVTEESTTASTVSTTVTEESTTASTASIPVTEESTTARTVPSTAGTTDTSLTTPLYEWNYTCGGLLTQSFGVISSPFYPSNYPPYCQCIWEIRTTPNTSIELRFQNINLENHPSCIYDSVTIYDGPLGSSVLGKICQPVNTTYRSSSNLISIEFISDGKSQYIGFEARYNTLAAPNSNSDAMWNTPSYEKCGGILTNLIGAINSASADTPDCDYCVWYISVNNNYKIYLNFSQFLRKTALSCHSFSLSVYDGTPHGSPLLGQLCEQSARVFTSSSNSISIVYSKRNNDTYSGLEFSASYYSVFNNNENVSLSCYSDYMEARVSSWYLESLGHSSDNIFLNDPQCRPRVVPGWLEFHIPYQSCQTVKQVQSDMISYENTLFTYSINPVVIHRKKLSLLLRCQMYQDIMVETLYNADDVMESNYIQHGLYSANLTFFQSATFIYPVYEFPYCVDLNQNLFLQASLDTSDPALVLFVDTCVASPDPFAFTRNVHYIIRNGCRKIPDYKTYLSSSLSTVRFGFNAFSFLSQYSSVYMHCTLVVCNRYDSRSRCNQGCVMRHKRSPDAHHDQVHVSAGPVLLKPHETVN